MVSHLSSPSGLGKFPSMWMESVLNVGDVQREWVAHLVSEKRLPAELQRGSGSHEQTRLLAHEQCAIRRAQLGELQVHADVHMYDKGTSV